MNDECMASLLKKTWKNFNSETFIYFYAVQQKENEICDLKSKMDEVANNLDGKIDR